MAQISHVSSYKKVVACAAFAIGALCPALAANCKVYEQKEAANLSAVSRVDPTMRAARLDTVFYSARQNACLASVYYSKGSATYAGIIDIEGQHTLWARAYRGNAFSPVRIIAMDRDMDEAIRAMEFAPVVTNSNVRGYEFLPLLFDRTMNRLPSLKNALTASR